MAHHSQPSDTYQQALERAATTWGIEPEYRDTWGRWHVTTPEVKKAILAARGIRTETKEDLDRAVGERLLSEWGRLLPPVCVAGESAWPAGFPIHLPAALAQAHATLEVHWEDGTTSRQELSLAALESAGRIDLGGAAWVRKQTPLPPDARLGYHELELTVHGPQGENLRARMPLILCPDRAYTAAAVGDGRRTAGIALALYGLRSHRNWGCGDFTDLENAIDWAAADIGASFIGLNPLHAIANRQPFNASPYLPTSTFYRNPLYLDPERIEDFRASPRAQRWFGRAETGQELEALRSTALVEYERVWGLKLRALKLAFAQFLRHDYRRGTARARAFQKFLEQEADLLERFATWCALDDFLHRRNPAVWIWPDWPEEYRDPESAAVEAFAKKHWRLVLFYKYTQWQIDLQLARAQQHARDQGLAIGLFHDLALATDRCGADFWAYRPFFVAGCRVGAPPDGFSPKGQDWSFPPPDHDHHRQTGYRLFVESIRKSCRHGGALRIDHVMRLFRLYWIPEGMDPAHGGYVQDYCDELLHILALESVRNQVIVVGEDLGTVTSEIRGTLDGFHIYGYKVPYFERNDHGEFKSPQQYPERALVASSTHDLPTLGGFWLGLDIEARRSAGLLGSEESYRSQLRDRERDKQKLLDALFVEGLLPEWVPRQAGQIPELTGELHNALIGFMSLAPSRLLALNQEDLLKETEQQNLPATTWEHPNWRRRMPFTVEELLAGAARDYTRMFRSWLEKTGRR